jgi:hypothetical protein
MKLGMYTLVRSPSLLKPQVPARQPAQQRPGPVSRRGGRSNVYVRPAGAPASAAQQPQQPVSAPVVPHSLVTAPPVPIAFPAATVAVSAVQKTASEPRKATTTTPAPARVLAASGAGTQHAQRSALTSSRGRIKVLQRTGTGTPKLLLYSKSKRGHSMRRTGVQAQPGSRSLTWRKPATPVATGGVRALPLLPKECTPPSAHPSARKAALKGASILSTARRKNRTVTAAGGGRGKVERVTKVVRLGDSMYQASHTSLLVLRS